ncbi:hypothetical protein SAMN02927895_01471 [Belnapia rosea]|nr:hypothetical protein SAMN02927895_01471 [Belnapia rosea]
MSERRHAGRLRMDLVDLGLADAAIDALPVAGEGLLSAPADDMGHFLGCLYVREGSTLGGRVLARALDPLLGAGTERGRRFLAGNGVNEGDLWRDLCVALEESAAMGHLPGMVAGARAIFAGLEAWLDGLDADA